MVIQTTRFGKVQINQNEILNFSEGLLGFADLKTFVLLDDPNDDIFAWLQSCEEPSVAFPVLEPELFVENYHPTLAKSDLEAIQTAQSANAKLFSIITIPDDPMQMTANLKAPIAINVEKRLARQCVLQDNSLAIREPIFTQLQKRVVADPNRSIKEQATSLSSVAVKINPRLQELG